MSLQTINRLHSRREYLKRDFLPPIPSRTRMEGLLKTLRISFENLFIPKQTNRQVVIEKDTQELSAIVSTQLFFHKRGNDGKPPGKRRRTKRVRIASDSNKTITRKLEKTPEKNLTTLVLAPYIQDAIGDHAYRRVQLFYYLAVIYYQMGCTVTRGKTLLQHGTSHHEWSSAAHSCILPNVTDNFETVLRQVIRQKGWTKNVGITLVALGISAEKIHQFKKDGDIDALLDKIDLENGILHRTSDFYDQMNSTVELPHLANELDSAIERTMRSQALTILNKVSKEALHPYRAAHEFVKRMGVCFETIQNALQKQLALMRKIQSVVKQIWDLEQQFSKKETEMYLRALQKMKEFSQKMKLLNRHSICVRVATDLTWQKKYFSSKADAKTLKRNIRENPVWTPTGPKLAIERLENALEILFLQREQTIVPPYKMLSGKTAGGKRLPMDEKDLYSQKLHLIQRKKI